jgi:hypothetical protein
MNDYSDLQKCLINYLTNYNNWVLQGKYYVVCENNTNKYEFKLSYNKLYEVKYCSLSNCETVFLETCVFGKHSGINTTKANYYIFVTKNKENINMFVKNKMLNNLMFITISIG